MVDLSKAQSEQIQILLDLKACSCDLSELRLPEPDVLEAKWLAEHEADEARRQQWTAGAIGDYEDTPEHNELVAFNRSLAQDILWSYHRLGDKSTKRRDAPTPGAWEMLAYARTEPKSFMTQLLPKAMAAMNSIRGADDFEAAVQCEERRAVAELRELLREAVEESQRTGN